MKVVHVTERDSSGAGRAALRIHTSLCKLGIDSYLLVLDKQSDLESVILPSNQILTIKNIFSKFSRKILRPSIGCKSVFSMNLLPSLLVDTIRRLDPDILHLHWVGNELIKIEDLAKFNIPIVWTFHDMWAFTGGCHYSHTCERYVSGCGHCPQLRGHSEKDFSQNIFKRKVKAWHSLTMGGVAPSKWMAQCAESSPIFENKKIAVIPNPLDISIYKPKPQSEARDVFGLPQNKQIILFGALHSTKDPRKGFVELIESLTELRKTYAQDQIDLVVFGASSSSYDEKLGFKIHYLGRLNSDELLASAYASADVMVVPSIQESFGQTAAESLACGTPVAAFRTTGLIDVVDHKVNGYLATPFSTADLANGIKWILDFQKKSPDISDRAQSKAKEKFSDLSVSQKYQLFYEDVKSLAS